MNKTIKLSFDFDNTLSKKHVQDYVKSLINQGFDIWIVTSRYKNCNDYLGLHQDTENNCHQDLYGIVNTLGIPENRIIFTNMKSKWKTLLKMTNVLFHLDDDWKELNEINKYSSTIGISVTGSNNWKKKCNKLIKKYENMAY